VMPVNSPLNAPVVHSRCFVMYLSTRLDELAIRYCFSAIVSGKQVTVGAEPKFHQQLEQS